MASEGLLTIRQAADYMGVNINAFSQIREEHQLMPASMDNGIPMYQHADLERVKANILGQIYGESSAPATPAEHSAGTPSTNRYLDERLPKQGE